MTINEFRRAKSNCEFADWNEVYKDTFYGTKSESFTAIKNEGKIPLIVAGSGWCKKL
jgi:guanylate kinase